MATKNTSDNIEDYIKNLLAQSGIAEIKRSLLADTFQVVPSQINYVIKTRFTESRGYTVESKRGGGGYIRIAKVHFSDKHQMLGNLQATIGEQISQQVYEDIIQLLFEDEVISEREGHLL
ncbi:CtsR family transcriptional regulator, partial [Streptococcus suis]